jgi:penicillin-binding protein 1A
MLIPPRPMRNILQIAVRATLILMLLVAVATAAIGGRVAVYYAYEIELPDHYRVTNEVSVQVCSDGKRPFVPLARIPPIVRDAVLAAVEPYFYARPPLNPLLEIAKAFVSADGPRAIPLMSMMLARCLTDLIPGRQADSLMIAASIVVYRLERDVSKDAIFEVFLNEAWMGRGSYGVAAAAEAYFGKSLTDLSLDEAAFIAALTKASGRNLRGGNEQRNRILDRMVEAGAITSSQAEIAKLAPLRLIEARNPI